MSSSIVRRNMKAKKRPAPPRKCQMSCLKMLDFDKVVFFFNFTRHSS